MKIGDRVKLSESGIRAGFERKKSTTGIVVCVKRFYVKVRRDGFKVPTFYSKDFWEVMK